MPNRSEFRPGTPEQLRDIATRYVDRLIELASTTDPSLGEGSEKGKDQKAFRALRLVQLLVSYLAQWAIDHQTGLGIHGQRFVPRDNTPGGVPGYKALVDAANSHEHELAGNRANESWANISAQNKRLALTNLLSANPSAFSELLIIEICESLRALDHGENLPLLERARQGKKVSYLEMRLQMRALGFVEYRRARGMLLHKALKEVADAYGVSPVTLNGWGKRLGEDFGPFEVARERALAREVARKEDAHRKGRFSGKKSAHPEGTWDTEYRDEALRIAAAQYNLVQRQ